MKAIVLQEYGGPEVLRLQDIERPEVGSEEILIEIAATAVNRADLLERQGLYPPPPPAPRYQIPGLECAGTVVAKGERVIGFNIGDRVMALLPGGGYAQYVAVAEDMAWLVPEALDLTDAAAIPEVYLTAFDALWNKAELMPEDRVLIHAAAGGVGSAAVQLALAAGLQVAATVGNEEKRQFVGKLGAHLVINYRDQDFVEAIDQWTQGQGVQAVIDFVGQSYLSRNLQSLAAGGTLVIVGTLSGPEATINLGQILNRRLTIRGTALRSRPSYDKMRLVQTFARRTMVDFNTGRLKPIIDRIMPWEQAGEAHRILATNQTTGKLVLKVR
ncbi:MAG: NADPH quinone oxidoreductase [Sulfobacillus benefaciens]|uniref:NADPH quinone oxidoreductase n=1 Tax=Sulfobacillus benefaciens TaxID=453960 RepID=A0A2T2XBV1_9FIRM|nr:MAG: NADPH quinone oxidoreductase [Sulfobacillus benefaciens]